MTRPMLLLVASFTLAAGASVTGFALPALAGPQVATDPAIVQPQIDLEAIPVQPVQGPLSVKGVAGDDDEGSVREAESSGHIDEGDRADRHEDDEDD